MIECILVAGTFFFNVGLTGVVYETSMIPVASTTVKINHRHHKDETTVIFVTGEVWARVDVEYESDLTALDIVSSCDNGSRY